MVEGNNIINYLYNKKEIDRLNKLTNNELLIQQAKTKELETQLSLLINKKIHPKCRKQLKNLIDNYVFEILGCSAIEKELTYQIGFSDSIKLILTALDT